MEPPVPPRPPSLSFTHLEPIVLDIAESSVIDAYNNPTTRPHIENDLYITPADAMHIWVKDRLRTFGHEKRMEIIITEASVIETPLDTLKGLKGTLKNEPASRLDAKLAVEMRVYGETSAMSEANVNAMATASRTIPENASVADRDQVYDQLIKSLMSLMNAEMEKNFQQYLSNYLRHDSRY